MHAALSILGAALLLLVGVVVVLATVILILYEACWILRLGHRLTRAFTADRRPGREADRIEEEARDAVDPVPGSGCSLCRHVSSCPADWLSGAETIRHRPRLHVCGDCGSLDQRPCRGAADSSRPFRSTERPPASFSLYR